MKLQPPRITVLADAAIPALQPDDTYENLRITELNAANANARNISFDECELRRPVLAGLQAEKLQLRDVCIKGGDLSTARFSDAAFIRTTCQDVRMTGLDVSRSKIKHVTFSKCKLNMANFRFATLHHVVFDDCNLTECDFQSATISDVAFRNCLLVRTSIDNARCERVDMRGSQLGDISGWQSAKGISIDSVQLMHIAPELAAALAITINDG